MKITDIMNGRIIRIRLYGYSEGEKMFQTENRIEFSLMKSLSISLQKRLTEKK